MMKLYQYLVIVFVSLQVMGSEIQLVDLKCDYRVTPLAVDRQDPLLSWRLEDERQGLAQRAYQIQAATSEDKFKQPDLWDSGWVAGERSTAIEYAGKPFLSKQRVYWRVRIKDDIPPPPVFCLDNGWGYGLHLSHALLIVLTRSLPGN